MRLAGVRCLFQAADPVISHATVRSSQERQIAAAARDG